MTEHTEPKQDVIIEHDYDGIQEYDNKMPVWWVYAFLVSVIIAAGYMLYYHGFGIGDSQTVRYLKQMDPDYRPLPGENDNFLGGVFPSYRSPFFTPDHDVMQLDLRGTGAVQLGLLRGMEAAEINWDVVAFTDAAALQAGREVFEQFCFTCHAIDGGGGIGPNLTDDYWLHGDSYPEIYHTVTYGVPVKGMIAWNTQLSEEQIGQVSSYVQTLHGTTPESPKPPQGELLVMEE